VSCKLKIIPEDERLIRSYIACGINTLELVSVRVNDTEKPGELIARFFWIESRGR